MFNQTEKKTLKVLVLILVVFTPVSMIGRDYRKWLLSFLLNSYANIFIAPILAAKGYLKYPTRLLPSIYKSSIIYDYFCCSLITSWFCRATIKDNWKIALWKVWLFAIPQAGLEYWLEKNTQLIKYKRGWTWVHSLITIAMAKYFIRTLIIGMDKYDKRKNGNNNQKEESVSQ